MIAVAGGKMDLWIFISCGADRNTFRNVGVRVINRLGEFLVFDRGTGPILLNWDYRNDLPRDVPAGEFEQRSLEIVDRSHILIGVLGPTVPPVTRKEILRAYERQAAGEQMRAYVLADPAMMEADHRRLLAQVRRDYHRDISFGHYHSKEDFLHQMYRTLFRYLLDQNAPPSPPGPVGGIT